MARTKIVFTEEQNFRIAQLVEINKSIKDIVLDLEQTFNIKVSENTLHTRIKELGLERTDCRSNNKKDPTYEFSDEQKKFIEFMSETGCTLNEMPKIFEKEYGISVKRGVFDRLIQREGYVRGEPYVYKDTPYDEGEEVYVFRDTTSYGWVNEDEDEVDNYKPILEKIENPDKIVHQMAKDENLMRLMDYNNNLPYNYSNKGEREGLKDTWYNRDGFLKINVINTVEFNKAYTEYRSNGGQFRTNYELEQDMRFYTFKDKRDGRGELATMCRKEIKSWYEDNRERINQLYDIIVSNNYANCIEVIEFNKLCRELYELKIMFAEFAGAKPEIARNLKRGGNGGGRFDDFVDYMKNQNLL